MKGFLIIFLLVALPLQASKWPDDIHSLVAVSAEAYVINDCVVVLAHFRNLHDGNLRFSIDPLYEIKAVVRNSQKDAIDPGPQGGSYKPDSQIISLPPKSELSWQISRGTPHAGATETATLAIGDTVWQLAISQIQSVTLDIDITGGHAAKPGGTVSIGKLKGIPITQKPKPPIQVPAKTIRDSEDRISP